ncbi:MAG TPA: tetratricopeptide repeat protein [Candidatus Methylomirabilis sp.]|nr:tetratricopeptide repeat protein [Candidatus Methylomirabilis sp.]
MARITRKELKTDKFALEVEQTVDFFEEHRQDLVRYGGIALAVAVLIAGYVFYSRHQHTKREAALYHAIQVEETNVGPPTPGANMNFPTQEAKDQVALKEFSDVHAAWSGSAEGEIALYYIASIQSDQGKLAEAEKSFKEVADKGDEKYGSLAKLSLAQIYFSDGRDQQGQAILRDLMAHPTVFVSKEQAAITLARYLIAKNPAEARKLLDPLRTQPGIVGQTAITMYAELPPQ